MGGSRHPVVRVRVRVRHGPNLGRIEILEYMQVPIQVNHT